MYKYRKLLLFLNRIIYITGAAMLMVGLVLTVSAPQSALAETGAIWTNNSSCGDPQDINHFSIGDPVFLHGSGFEAGEISWNIKGTPGSLDPGIIVASGTVTVGADGAFCFQAYTIANDDGGEYQAKAGIQR